MSFIDLPLDIDSIQEDKPVPEGSYKLIITDCKERTDEGTGQLKGLLIICEIQGQPGAANVLHNMSLPLPGDEDEKVMNKMKFIKRFVQLFAIPLEKGKLNPAAFAGKSATCYLTQEEYNGNVSNKIKLPNAK